MNESEAFTKFYEALKILGEAIEVMIKAIEEVVRCFGEIIESVVKSKEFHRLVRWITHRERHRTTRTWASSHLRWRQYG